MEAAPAAAADQARASQMNSHASRLEKLKASVAKLQKDKEARMAQGASLAAAPVAAAADPSLQKYFPQQTGAQLPGAELATSMTQRASSPAASSPMEGEPIGPHSGVKWTGAEMQQQQQQAQQSQQQQAQEALMPTQQGHQQGQQQAAVAESQQSQQAQA